MAAWEDMQPVIDTLTGTEKFLSKKSINGLPDILKSNEILEAIAHAYYRDEPGIIACTNDRLIIITKPFFSTLNVKGFFLKEILSIKQENGLMGKKMTIYGSDKVVQVNTMDGHAAKEFSDFMHLKLWGFIPKEAGWRPHTSLEQNDDKQNSNLALRKFANDSNTEKDATDDMFEKLEKLASLKNKGILTDEEFLAQKQKILNI